MLDEGHWCGVRQVGVWVRSVGVEVEERRMMDCAQERSWQETLHICLRRLILFQKETYSLIDNTEKRPLPGVERAEDTTDMEHVTSMGKAAMVEGDSADKIVMGVRDDAEEATGGELEERGADGGGEADAGGPGHVSLLQGLGRAAEVRKAQSLVPLRTFQTKSAVLLEEQLTGVRISSTGEASCHVSRLMTYL